MLDAAGVKGIGAVTVLNLAGIVSGQGDGARESWVGRLAGFVAPSTCAGEPAPGLPESRGGEPATEPQR